MMMKIGNLTFWQPLISASGTSWQVEEMNAQITPAVGTVTKNRWMMLSKVWSLDCANVIWYVRLMLARIKCSAYVYWTVRHLDSWVKRDQLDPTCFIITFFSAQHVSDVNTSILRSLRLIRWVTSLVVLLWFDMCWCYVVVWLWWCGIRMQAEALFNA